MLEDKKGSVCLLLGDMKLAAASFPCWLQHARIVGVLLLLFFLLVKTEKRQRLKIKPIIFDTTVETWLVLTQQVAKGLDRQKPAVLSVQSKLSAEI